MRKAYSFLNVQATLVGPGGSINLGNGAGTSEEGISIDPNGDKNTMTIGADGSGMHSLHADKSHTVTVRILKTSPTNAQLQAMYDLQASSAALWGQNVITVTDISSGDSTDVISVAFKKKPAIRYGKDGQMLEWAFDAIQGDTLLGTY